MKAAIYARYSTDRQSETSIEDQERVCGDFARSKDLQVVARFEDQGISGAAIGNRPGFLKMMDAATSGTFDVLVVMDLSRLSRSQSDLPKTIDRLTHKGIRVIGTQDGYDSQRKGHKLQAGLSGIMGEAFREITGEKTHVGQERQVRRGFTAGGKVYGYSLVPERDPGRLDPHGQPVRIGTRLAVDPTQADVIRQIFRWYVEGCSPRWIAAELNRRGIPSPGSTWNRTQRRAKGWCPSAIHGDPKRGAGILNNGTYVGRPVWNRLKWIKDPDTGKRRAILRPSTEWIVTEDPDLRIIDDETWRLAKARQERRREEVGDKIRKGLKKSTGRAPRYLFTSLLRCAECGSSFVMADSRSYACSGYLNGSICSVGIRVKREIVEARLLADIQSGLLTDEAIERFKRRVIRAAKRPDQSQQRRQELQKEVDRYADAIGAGLLSPTVKARLEAAEAELAALARTDQVIDVGAILAALPRLIDRYRAMVADLGNVARTDPDRARECIRSILGEIRVEAVDGVLVARYGLNETPLTALTGGVHIGVVAGAGFEPATFGL